MEAFELDNYTYQDYLDIDKSTPDSERYELIFGHIYMMSGASRPHQDVVLNIAMLFKALEKSSKCATVIAPYDIKLKCVNQTNVVQPDVMLFCEDENLPCLVAEVLSPSTAIKDKQIKKDLYECSLIQNYLIIDPINRYIDKYTLQDSKYIYEKCYGDDEEMFLECINQSVETKEFFSDKKEDDE
jgi:Uma2 family endonuclease